MFGVLYTGALLSVAYALRYHPYAVGRTAGTASALLITFVTAREFYRATKAAPRVVIYCHKDAQLLAKKLAAEKIHRAIAGAGLDEVVAAPDPAAGGS